MIEFKVDPAKSLFALLTRMLTSLTVHKKLLFAFIHLVININIIIVTTATNIYMKNICLPLHVKMFDPPEFIMFVHPLGEKVFSSVCDWPPSHLCVKFFCLLQGHIKEGKRQTDSSPTKCFIYILNHAHLHGKLYLSHF